jgi:transposase-like protein
MPIMAMRVETNPLEAAYAALLENGLDGAGEALRILVNEAAKIERSAFLGARPYERTETRRDYANGFKPKTVLTRHGELTFQVPQVRSSDFWAPRKTVTSGRSARSPAANPRDIS